MSCGGMTMFVSTQSSVKVLLALFVVFMLDAVRVDGCYSAVPGNNR